MKTASRSWRAAPFAAKSGDVRFTRRAVAWLKVRLTGTQRTALCEMRAPDFGITGS